MMARQGRKGQQGKDSEERMARIYIKENLDRGPREDYPARG